MIELILDTDLDNFIYLTKKEFGWSVDMAAAVHWLIFYNDKNPRYYFSESCLLNQITIIKRSESGLADDVLDEHDGFSIMQFKEKNTDLLAVWDYGELV